MKNAMSFLGLCVTLFSGSTVFADQIATIDLVSVAGSGCQKDDFAVAIAPDRTAFTVSYSNYTALAGKDTTVMDRRKNCNLSVRVTVPGGFTYGIAAADIRGFVDLQPTANAQSRVSLWFQGNPQTSFVTHQLRAATFGAPGHNVLGRLIDNWETHDETPFGSIVFASCSAQRNLNVNTELRISQSGNSNETSLVTTDTTDASLTTLIHLAIRRCP